MLRCSNIIKSNTKIIKVVTRTVTVEPLCVGYIYIQCSRYDTAFDNDTASKRTCRSSPKLLERLFRCTQ